MEEYYHILGISGDANRQEIRQAYRKLAKKYHPDHNPAPDAERQFIRITEAYEILIGERPMPRNTPRATNRPNFRDRRRSQGFRWQSYRQMWEEERQGRRKEARAKAKAYARMRYEKFRQHNEAFRRSWYYKPVYYLVWGIVLTGWLLGIFLLISPLLAAYFFTMQDSHWWKGLLCLPLSVSGLICIRKTHELREEAAPFFKEPFHF